MKVAHVHSTMNVYTDFVVAVIHSYVDTFCIFLHCSSVCFMSCVLWMCVCKQCVSVCTCTCRELNCVFLLQLWLLISMCSGFQEIFWKPRPRYKASGKGWNGALKCVFHCPSMSLPLLYWNSLDSLQGRHMPDVKDIALGSCDLDHLLGKVCIYL